MNYDKWIKSQISYSRPFYSEGIDMINGWLSEYETWISLKMSNGSIRKLNKDSLWYDTMLPRGGSFKGVVIYITSPEGEEKKYTIIDNSNTFKVGNIIMKRGSIVRAKAIGDYKVIAMSAGNTQWSFSMMICPAPPRSIRFLEDE